MPCINKKILSKVKHPIGKYVLGCPSGDRIDLMCGDENGHIVDGYFAFGAPSKAATRYNSDGTIKYKLKASKIVYFEKLWAAIVALKRIAPNWRIHDNIYKTTKKGLRLVRRGKNLK